MDTAVRSRPDAPAGSAPVPFVDLGLQHRRVAAEVARRLDEVMSATSFVLGPQVTEFEERFAAYCGVRHCVGVGNGTDALELALRAAGVGPGDEVIVPANPFVATAESVVRAGARLVLADCDADGLLDPAAAADRVTPCTRAVVPVHLYGQVAPVERVREAVGPGILVVEDAAQSQGARRHGAAAGSFGVAAATSFYPGKNLGAYGDAGAVVTDEDEVADRVRALRNHGGLRKYEHDVLGTNSRLDSMQAVVLTAKLPHLDAWNAERDAAAARYHELLAGVAATAGLLRPRALPGNDHVWHLYVVRVPRRDEVLAALTAAGIGAGIHYPLPVHLLPAFRDLGAGPGSHPVAERLAGEILSLPMFPGITPDQQERVAAAVVAALGP
ncbi:MAG: DegT/DnrJ/EryC1/StrS family aminotransferase [Kineosporiaceae bacterium]